MIVRGACLLLSAVLVASGCSDEPPDAPESEQQADTSPKSVQVMRMDGSAPPEAKLPFTDCSTANPPSLGGEPINVYCADASRDKPFIAPYVRIDWQKAAESLAGTCRGKKGDVSVRVKADLELMSTNVQREVIEELTSKNMFRGANRSIFIHPYAGISLIKINEIGEPVPIYEYPRGWKYRYSRNYSVNREFPTSVPPLMLDGTCRELGSLIEERNIQGEIYYQYVEIVSNAISAAVDGFVRSDQYLSIFKNQRQTGARSVSTSGRSRGGGINVGPISIGGGSSRGTNTESDDRHRFTSEDVVMSAAEEYAQSIRATMVSEYSGGAVDATSFAEMITNYVLSNANDVTLRVRSLADGGMELSNGSYRATLNTEQAKLVLETKPGSPYEASSKEKGNFNYGAIGGGSESERNQKFGFGPEVKWEKSGKDWVPHSVRLKSIVRMDAREVKDIVVTEAKVRYGNSLGVRTLRDVYQAASNGERALPEKDGIPLAGEGLNVLAARPVRPPPPALGRGGFARAIHEVAMRDYNARYPPLPPHVCVPGYYTASHRTPEQLGGMVLEAPRWQLPDRRTIYRVAPNTMECSTQNESSNCVHLYAVCRSTSEDKGCAVRHRWMLAKHPFPSLPGPVPQLLPLDQICEES